MSENTRSFDDFDTVDLDEERQALAIIDQTKLPSKMESGPPHGFLSDLASDGVYMDPPCYQDGGSLLHCLFTLTSLQRERRYVSVALSRESPPPAVNRYPAL